MTQDSGMDVSPSWQELKDERDALAAHVERISEWWGDDSKTRLDLGEFAEIIAGQPAASLARRDARMKAEAMDSLVASDLVGELHKEFIRRCASEYRRQAEGGES